MKIVKDVFEKIAIMLFWIPSEESQFFLELRMLVLTVMGKLANNKYE
jgi:hypothetical protein